MPDHEWLSAAALRASMEPRSRPSEPWIRKQAMKCRTTGNSKTWPRRDRCRFVRDHVGNIVMIQIRADAALDVPVVRRGRKPKAK